MIKSICIGNGLSQVWVSSRTCETWSFPCHMGNRTHLLKKISHSLVFTFSIAQHVMETVSRPSLFHQFTIKCLLQSVESDGLVKHQCCLRGVEIDMGNVRFIKWFVIFMACFSQFCSFKLPQNGSCFSVVSQVLQSVKVLKSSKTRPKQSINKHSGGNQKYLHGYQVYSAVLGTTNGIAWMEKPSPS